jgi:menaquinone-dependent protoporphyrinogen IX oxidase
MHKIIVYSSKHGAVGEVVKMIEAECANVSSHNINQGDINVQKDDIIIIGTNVTASQINKQLKEFCAKPELLEVPIILFVSGLMKDISEVLKQNFSEELQQHMKGIFFVGGKLNFPEMNFFERNIIKVVNKKKKLIDYIDKNKNYDLFDYDGIKALIKTINETN